MASARRGKPPQRAAREARRSGPPSDQACTAPRTAPRGSGDTKNFLRPLVDERPLEQRRPRLRRVVRAHILRSVAPDRPPELARFDQLTQSVLPVGRRVDQHSVPSMVDDADEIRTGTGDRRDADEAGLEILDATLALVERILAFERSEVDVDAR